MLTRRDFLHHTATGTLLPFIAADRDRSDRSRPYRVLYSHDTTNILSCR